MDAVDDARLLRGRGRYLDDRDPEGVLYLDRKSVV